MSINIYSIYSTSFHLQDSKPRIVPMTYDFSILFFPFCPGPGPDPGDPGGPKKGDDAAGILPAIQVLRRRLHRWRVRGRGLAD